MEFVPINRRGFRTTFIILIGILACKSLIMLIPLTMCSLLCCPVGTNLSARLEKIRVCLWLSLCSPIPWSMHVEV